MERNPADSRRTLAYFSAQAVVEGQDSWAAVMEIVHGVRRAGWRVDLYRPEYPAGHVPGAWTRIARIAGVQWRLALKLRRADALYVRSHPLAWPIATMARLRGVPVIQECNGSWEDAFIAWPASRRTAGLIVALQRSQYRGASAIVAVSDGLARWLSEVTGRTDVAVSPNGANDELFRPHLQPYPGLPERFVVFFGQFAPWQRIEVLLAAATLPEWPEGVALVLVGDGALRPQVEAVASENPHVHYLGQLPYETVPHVVSSALASAVLTFAPDRAGYSPLKLYESMACGVPVICSDTPGQAEYVREEQAGVVVAPEDPAAIAHAASQLAADPEGAREMGARGRAAVGERYSWSARCRQRLAVIEAVVTR